MPRGAHGSGASYTPPPTAGCAAMTKPEPTDPNAELRGFEPLRVALALGALLLGLVMSMH